MAELSMTEGSRGPMVPVRDRPAVVAVLVKRFPRLSETFVLNEFLELRRQGVPIRLHAVLDPVEASAQPEAEALRPEVRYVRRGEDARAWVRVARAAASVAARHPRGTIRAGAFAFRRRSVATLKHLGEALVLVGQLEDEGAAHLHAHFAHGPAAIAHLAHLVSGIPYSFTAHAKDLYTTPPAYVAARGDAATFVVTCTEANGRYLAGLLGPSARKVVVCRHGVDLDRFAAVRQRPVPGRILAVGRLVPKKGFDVLLRALAILREWGVPFEAHLVGGGPLRDELIDLAASLGLAGAVSFAGGRPQPALLEEYAEAAVFALSPRITGDGDRDGIPNVLAEAMAVGVPIVSTTISGIPEVIRSGETGILVPPEDPAALAEALGTLLGDATLRDRLRGAARRWILETGGLEEAVRPLARLFGERLAAANGISR